MLTVAPFNVDVDAHFDAAEELVLCHSHLHADGCTGDTILISNELVLEAAACTLMGNL